MHMQYCDDSPRSHAYCDSSPVRQFDTDNKFLGQNASYVCLKIFAKGFVNLALGAESSMCMCIKKVIKQTGAITNTCEAMRPKHYIHTAVISTWRDQNVYKYPLIKI